MPRLLGSRPFRPLALKPPLFKNILKNKGRYLLLALALWGLFAWWRHERGGTVQLALKPSIAPSCAAAPPTQAAPKPPFGLTGQLGLWVAKVDPATLRPIQAVAADPNGTYPLASSYKQAVLWALLRAVDAGRVGLSEKFSVTTANQSLGRYPYDGSSVTTLATRMIHNSDNTATDILHRRVGLESVQAVADDLGLCRTRLILPTKAWWTAQSGLDATWPGARVFQAAAPKERLALARALDKAAQGIRSDVLQAKLNQVFVPGYDISADLGTHNVSTPYEFGTLIAHEFLKSGLSPSSRELQREVMATGFGRSQLRVPTAYFGGKGGNGWKLLTMTGYFETPRGEHVVYVFMQHGSTEDDPVLHYRLAFDWIGAAINQVLTPPELAGVREESSQP